MFIRFLLCIYFLEYAIAVRSDAEIKTWFFRQTLECNKDYPLNSDELHLLHEHKMPDTHTAKCAMACVFKKAKMLDGNGNFAMDSSIAIATDDYAGDETRINNSIKLFQLCQKVNEETVTDGKAGCDRAKFLFDCLVKNSPKLGIPLN